LHIKAKEGDKVEVGAVLGSIDESVQVPAKLAAERGQPALAATRKPAGERSEPAGLARPIAIVPASSALSPTARRAARQAAQENGPPAKTAAKPKAERKEAPESAEKRVAMSAIRQRIAERLLTSQKSTASLTTFNEIDMSAVMDLRARFKDSFKQKHRVNLGFMAFFVKTSIEALKAYPLANASIDGRDIVYHQQYDIGVAVSTEKGLMVPVLRDAEKMSFADIEKAIADLAIKARDGKIEIADLQGGTFTITNGGVYGSMLSTPILNFPQSAILGMHAIQKRPVVRDDQVVIRPMMYVALTYDHRLIDGREAVLFLVRIKECIEDPQRLLLEI
jgi:2-oxoglutarate dehydrogenase E2 component (dihydrolipoamide succinyltransferase)